MKMMKFAIVLFLFAVQAFAIPQVINYQGQLASQTGTPLDTTVAMTFNLYPVVSGGATGWSETHPAVVVTDGLFNVRLGSVIPLPDFFSVNSWLSVTIGADTEMSPREQIVSVGHAYRAGTVDGATGGTITGKLNVGSGNTNSGSFANVLGESNSVSGNWGAISGGSNNISTEGFYNVIGGGAGNIVEAGIVTISGGSLNHAFPNAYNSVIAGGEGNYVNGIFGVIGGGNYNNVISDSAATIAGGFFNRVSANYSAIGGGAYNIASGQGSVVSGGVQDSASGSYSTVGGGQGNSANFVASTIGGGRYNTASSNATVSGGVGNSASGNTSTVGGGGGNTANGNSATASGGEGNMASGDYAIVGGGHDNIASGISTTIDGGEFHTASGNYATVGGGAGNSASGYNSTIGGGSINSASNFFATVGGGIGNSASGIGSCIPGGRNNSCSGEGSFTCGNYAHSVGDSSFVFNDGRYGGNIGGQARRFIVVASNGTFIHTNSTATLGAQLPANSTAWEAICDSTKKERYGQVNTRDVLSKLTMIPIETWSYKDDPNHIKHIGPMAQDFYAAFHVGESDTTISTLDPDGVALAAIQELAKQNEQKDTKITELEARVKQLEAAILQFGNLTQTDKQ